MNRRTDRQRKRGSLTVEASLVVPMCVMILALLLSLTFCVYLRCWYTQTACEAAVQGSGYGVLEGRSGQEKAEKKMGNKAQGEWIFRTECYRWSNRKREGSTGKSIG